MNKPRKKVPRAVKAIRKQLPPPEKIFKDKKKYSRKRAKEELRQEWKEKPPARPDSSVSGKKPAV